MIKYVTILLVKFLQRKYKSLSIEAEHLGSSNQRLSKLILIQHILHYFKEQFGAWGYFHPSCSWFDEDEEFYNKLFPPKDDSFYENEIVIWHNPEAVTFYHNMIFKKYGSLNYGTMIKKQLIKWKVNN